MNKATRELERQESREAMDRIERTAAALKRREASTAARMAKAGAGVRRVKVGGSLKRAGSAAYRPESGPVIASGAYAVIRNDAWAALCAMLGEV